MGDLPAIDPTTLEALRALSGMDVGAAIALGVSLGLSLGGSLGWWAERRLLPAVHRQVRLTEATARAVGVDLDAQGEPRAAVAAPPLRVIEGGRGGA